MNNVRKIVPPIIAIENNSTNTIIYLYLTLENCIGNNRSQAHKNSGFHYLRACRPIFPY